MPYSIRRREGKFVIIKTDTGEVVSRHDTLKKAQAAINLRRGVEHGWKPTGKGAG